MSAGREDNDVIRGLNLFLRGADLAEHIESLPLEQVQSLQAWHSSEVLPFVAQIRAVGQLLAAVDLSAPDKEIFPVVGHLITHLADQCDLSKRVVDSCSYALDPEARRRRGLPPLAKQEAQP